MPELDRYDQDDIDDEEVDENVTFEEAQNARLRAERELDRRDAREGVTGRRQRLPGALEGECGSPSHRFLNSTLLCSLAVSAGCPLLGQLQHPFWFMDSMSISA